MKTTTKLLTVVLATAIVANFAGCGPFDIFGGVGERPKPKPIAMLFHDENEIFQDDTIDGDEVLVGHSKNITLTIKNTGASLLTIDTANIAITGTDAAAFIKATDPGSNISVGNQSSFSIEFKPVKQGENGATLTIPTNDDAETL